MLCSERSVVAALEAEAYTRPLISSTRDAFGHRTTATTWRVPQSVLTL